MPQNTYFVYGTLKGAGMRTFLPKGCEIVSQVRGSADGTLYDVGPFPAALFEVSSSHKVVGEIITIEGTEEALEALRLRLHRYEGFVADKHPHNLYFPVHITCLDSAGVTHPAMGYQWAGETHNMTVVPDGEWARG